MWETVNLERICTNLRTFSVRFTIFYVLVRVALKWLVLDFRAKGGYGKLQNLSRIGSLEGLYTEMFSIPVTQRRITRWHSVQKFKKWFNWRRDGTSLLVIKWHYSGQQSLSNQLCSAVASREINIDTMMCILSVSYAITIKTRRSRADKGKRADGHSGRGFDPDYLALQ